MRPPDLPIRSAAVAVGAALSVLPLVAGGSATDLAFVVAGVLAAAGAAAPGPVPGVRLGSALPTVCLLAAVGHLAVRPVSPVTSVGEGLLAAAYLALACESEIARGTPVVQLRWAAGPMLLAACGASAAAAAAVLADRARSPLAVVVTGVAAVVLLVAELHRRRAR